MFQIYKPHKLPVRSYYSNTKAEAVSYHLLSGRIGSWEVGDQLGLDLSYASNAAPADPAALGAPHQHTWRGGCTKGPDLLAGRFQHDTALGKRMNSDVWRTA